MQTIYQWENILQKAPIKLVAGIVVVALSIGIGGQAAAREMSEYPTVKNPENFDINWTEFYHEGNRRTEELRKKFPNEIDIAYGQLPKQRLDIYMPKGNVDKAPVLLFLHGGGFKEGDKSHYGFVAEPYVENGVVVAVASYRLAIGGSHYPDQVTDTRSVIKWLHDNVAEFGGDPESLYVSGHSAGAMIAADVSVDRSWLPKMGVPVGALKGVVLISGRYNFLGEGGLDHYVPTSTLRYAASPLLHLRNPVPWSLVTLGSEEQTYMESSKHMVDALNASGSRSGLLVLDGEDHRQAVESFANADSELVERILAALKK